MATVRSLFQRVLRAAGVIGKGQTAASSDIQDALELCNDMLAEWSMERWLVYRLREYSRTSTGAVSYTIGPGGNFDTTLVARPDRIEYAFVRQLNNTVPNQVDYALELIAAREDYARIQVKQLGPFPWGVFYDTSFPLGTLYFYPVPQVSIYAMHVGVKEVLPEFASLDEVIAIPRVYNSAIYWNLAQRLRPAYQKLEDVQINRRAWTTLKALRNANIQMPRLVLPIALVRSGIYNVLTDQNY